MKIVIPVIALSALIASGVSAWSGSPSTNNLQIRMKIDKGCTVNPGGNAVLDFGTISGLDYLTYIYVETAIQIQCTKGVNYSIALDGGKHPSDIFQEFRRYLTPESGAFVERKNFPYELFSDSARTKPWGDGSKRDMPVFSDIPAADGSVKSIPVYARGYAERDTPPGTYTDTVTVTVKF